MALGIPARLAFYDWDANVIGNPDQPLTDLARAVRRGEESEPRAEEDDLPPTGAEQNTVDRYGGDESRICDFYDHRNDAIGATYYAEAGGRVIAGPETTAPGWRSRSPHARAARRERSGRPGRRRVRAPAGRPRAARRRQRARRSARDPR